MRSLAHFSISRAFPLVAIAGFGVDLHHDNHLVVPLIATLCDFQTGTQSWDGEEKEGKKEEEEEFLEGKVTTVDARGVGWLEEKAGCRSVWVCGCLVMFHALAA